MSKKEKKDYGGQSKPKLKIKINFNNQDHEINEYDLAQMIANNNKAIAQLTQGLQGVIDGMKAGAGVTTEQYHETGSPYTTEPQVIPTVQLPKLTKVEGDDVSVNLVD